MAIAKKLYCIYFVIDNQKHGERKYKMSNERENYFDMCKRKGILVQTLKDGKRRYLPYAKVDTIVVWEEKEK